MAPGDSGDTVAKSLDSPLMPVPRSLCYEFRQKFIFLHVLCSTACSETALRYPILPGCHFGLHFEIHGHLGSHWETTSELHDMVLGLKTV